MDIYKKVVEVLVNEKVNFTSIGKRLAQEHPEIFMSMLSPESKAGWKERLDIAIDRYGCCKISAIKIVRDANGWDLRTAKDYIDATYRYTIFRGDTRYDDLPASLKR